MPDQVYVQVVHLDGRVEVQLGPMSEREAERVKRGLLINLDTDNYYVEVTQ